MTDPADTPVREAVRAYAARQPGLREPTRRFAALVTGLLDEAGINYLTVDARTKSVASFAAKAARTVEGRPLYADPLVEITDQVGVRVITYVHSDVAAVVELFDDQLVVLDDRDMGEETASEGRWGYASRHLLVAVPEEAPESYEDLVGHRASIQVRTVLQHAWAEFEHDIRYKGTVPEEHAPDLDRRFTLAAGLLQLADQEFSTIRARLQGSTTGRSAPPTRTRPTRGSAARSWRRSSPASTPTPAGRTPTTTAGSPACCSSSASPRSTSSPGCSPRSTRTRSSAGWATATRPAPSAASTTRCSPSSVANTSTSPATPTGSRS